MNTLAADILHNCYDLAPNDNGSAGRRVSSANDVNSGNWNAPYRLTNGQTTVPFTDMTQAPKDGYNMADPTANQITSTDTWVPSGNDSAVGNNHQMAAFITFVANGTLSVSTDSMRAPACNDGKSTPGAMKQLGQTNMPQNLCEFGYYQEAGPKGIPKLENSPKPQDKATGKGCANDLDGNSVVVDAKNDFFVVEPAGPQDKESTNGKKPSGGGQFNFVGYRAKAAINSWLSAKPTLSGSAMQYAMSYYLWSTGQYLNPQGKQCSAQMKNDGPPDQSGMTSVQVYDAFNGQPETWWMSDASCVPPVNLAVDTPRGGPSAGAQALQNDVGATIKKDASQVQAQAAQDYCNTQYKSVTKKYAYISIGGGTHHTTVNLTQLDTCQNGITGATGGATASDTCSPYTTQTDGGTQLYNACLAGFAAASPDPAAVCNGLPAGTLYSTAPAAGGGAVQAITAKIACDNGVGQTAAWCNTTYSGHADAIQYCTIGALSKAQSDKANSKAAGSQTQASPTTTAKTDNTPPKSDCSIDGVGWLICPVVTFLSKAADGLFSLVSDFLTINDTSGPYAINGPAYKVYQKFLAMANVLLAVLFLVIIYSEAVGGDKGPGMMSNYNVKKTLPRLLLIAVVLNLAWYVCMAAIDLSNIIGQNLFGFLGQTAAGVVPKGTSFGSSGTTGTFGAVVGGVLLAGGVIAMAGSGALGLIALAAIITFLMIFLILIIRQVAVLALTIIAPIAFAMALLPNTQSLFKKWWNAFYRLLLIFPIIALMYGFCQLGAAVFAGSTCNDQTGCTGPGFVMQIAAAAASVLPLFLIPVILKGSLKALGSVGAAVGGFAAGRMKGAQNRARGAAKTGWQNSGIRSGGLRVKGGLAKGATKIPGLKNNRGLQRASAVGSNEALRRDDEMVKYAHAQVLSLSQQDKNDMLLGKKPATDYQIRALAQNGDMAGLVPGVETEAALASIANRFKGQAGRSVRKDAAEGAMKAGYLAKNSDMQGKFVEGGNYSAAGFAQNWAAEASADDLVSAHGGFLGQTMSHVSSGSAQYSHLQDAANQVTNEQFGRTKATNQGIIAGLRGTGNTPVQGVAQQHQVDTPAGQDDANSFGGGGVSVSHDPAAPPPPTTTVGGRTYDADSSGGYTVPILGTDRPSTPAPPAAPVTPPSPSGNTDSAGPRINDRRSSGGSGSHIGGNF